MQRSPPKGTARLACLVGILTVGVLDGLSHPHVKKGVRREAD